MIDNGSTEKLLASKFAAEEGEALYLEYPDRARSHAGWERQVRFHKILNLALTIVLVGSLAAVWMRGDHTQAGATQYDLYSPILEAIGDENFQVTSNLQNTGHFNETGLFNDPKNSPYMYGRPEDIDGNWTSLIRVGMMGLTEEERIKVGAPAGSVRLPPESGGGYLSFLSSHHHLHCLYMLHQSLHSDWYSTRSIVWDMEADRRLWHFDHCVDMLRQFVMCRADTTVITHDWYQGKDDYAPRVENPRKCVDWDRYFRWQLSRQVPAPNGPLVKPADAVEVEVGVGRGPVDT